MKMQVWAISTMVATNKKCHINLEIKQNNLIMKSGTTYRLQTILALLKVGFFFVKTQKYKTILNYTIISETLQKAAC